MAAHCISPSSIFVAQAAGIELSIQTQVLMMLTLMLTSKGVAGVPRASLVILAGTLTSFGLPLEGVAVLLGVDSILDMAQDCPQRDRQLPCHGSGCPLGGGTPDFA